MDIEPGTDTGTSRVSEARLRPADCRAVAHAGLFGAEESRILYERFVSDKGGFYTRTVSYRIRGSLGSGRYPIRTLVPCPGRSPVRVGDSYQIRTHRGPGMEGRIR